MKKYVFFLLFPFLVSCMETSKKSDRGEVIVINDFKGKKLCLSDFVEDVNFYNLETDSFVVGEIKDLCIYDSLLFFIDNLTSNLVVYDLYSHSISFSVNYQGNGPFEYVRPHALCVDEHCLYLLDSSSRKIISYNHSLKPQNEIRMDFAAFDFIKVENGFLLCSVLPEPTLDYKKVIYMNMSGEIYDSYIHTHQFGMTLGKNFVRGKDGTIYVCIPYSNQIYNWSKEDLYEFCYTDFGHLNVPLDDTVEDLSYYDSDYIHNNNFFVTSSYFINAFLYNGKMHYHFKENDTEKTFSGIIVDEKYGLPFFPRWQYEDKLIGICRLEELPETCKANLNMDDMEGMLVLIFNMKKNI